MPVTLTLATIDRQRSFDTATKFMPVEIYI
jgi:hypothetical protein